MRHDEAAQYSAVETSQPDDVDIEGRRLDNVGLCCIGVAQVLFNFLSSDMRLGKKNQKEEDTCHKRL